MTCACMPQEVAALRAELEQERLARARAEARLEGFREAVALMAASRLQESPHPSARHAGSVTVQRDGVTPSVTQEEKEKKQREKSAMRSKTYRLRQRSVTVQRDGVTPSVTKSLPPSFSSSREVARGSLALVTVAARDAQRDAPREHRTPATLPEDVAALRKAWNELVAPHGFPAWERTSARLMQDVRAALERRPLEEWRRVFALVPRSRVCRGELSSGQRASLVYLLTGRTRDGYEPAEKLLSGDWSVDPEPSAAPAQAPAASPVEAELAALPEDTPHASTWKQMLEALRADGKLYALGWLVKLRARGVVDGVLVLEAPDRYASAWAAEHYGALVGRMAEIQGYAGVRFEPTGEGAP